MGSKLKYYLAGLFFVGGLIVVLYNSPIIFEEEDIYGQPVEQKIEKTSIIYGDDTPADAELLVLYVLDSKVCSPCLNNVLEYNELFSEKKNKYKIYSKAFFVDSSEDDIERFIRLTDFPISYATSNGKVIPDALINTSEEMLLIDIKSGSIFYRLPIRNTTTSDLSYKKRVINKIFRDLEFK